VVNLARFNLYLKLLWGALLIALGWSFIDAALQLPSSHPLRQPLQTPIRGLLYSASVTR